jgi:phosphopantetheinyl transferase (holo-ACP synthase)
MIIGIGIDQVQIERIRKVAPRLFERICTEAEREYCERFGPEGRFERYAGRFAAK